MIVLVDGYNLLYALQYEGESIDKVGLIGKLVNYCGLKNNKVILVFDGGINGGEFDREERVGNLKIIYTSKIKTADDKIKELSKKYGNGCVVVTSDREIKNCAIRYGSGVINSEDFIYKLYGNCNNFSNFSGKGKMNRKNKNLLKKI